MPSPILRKRSLLANLLALFLLLALAGRATAQSEHPLEPPQTGSPRETIYTFLSSIEDVWGVIAEDSAENRTEEIFLQLVTAADRTRRTLDVSELPGETRKELSNEAGIRIYEVLCRIELPRLDEVPGPEEVEAQELERWSIPHTEITLARINEGPRAGEWLFSTETIHRAEEFFNRVEHLPYLRQPPIDDISYWRSVYGGWRIKKEWIDGLPSVMRERFGGHALWKWLATGTLFLVLALLAGLIYRFTRRGKDEIGLKPLLVQSLFPLSLFGLTKLATPLITNDINLTGDAGNAVLLFTLALSFLALAWVVWQLALLVGEAIIASPRVRAESLDADLIRLACQVFGLAGAAAVVFQGANRLGVPVVGVIASLSVGGLAVALAAQDTLRSLLASMTILIDQPYRVGERVIVAGHDGVVQRIGLRSTRIRTLAGNVTSMPNEVIAAKDIENVSRRVSIRRKTKLRIAIETPPAKVEEAVAIVRDILDDHEGMPEDQPPRVYFDEFNADSLSIVISYWYAPPDYWQFLDFGQRVNLQIVRRFEAAGIELAPPTSRMEVVGSGEVSAPPA